MPPGPEPGVAYAGFWIRFAAWLIDLVPLAIVSAIVLAPVLSTVFREFASLPPPPRRSFEFEAWYADYSARLAAITGPLYAASGLLQLLNAAYFIGFWAWRGQTPGMMVFNLRVVRDVDGSRVGIARSILRYVGYLISSFVFLLGFIWAAFDDRKQGWHDKIAGTFVVRPSR